MLDHGRPHLVVAFLSGPEDPLTEHMVQIADKAGVPIEIADERGRTYAYNEARTDQYIPPPPAADDPKLDDPKLGMTVNPKKSQLDKQWFRLRGTQAQGREKHCRPQDRRTESRDGQRQQTFEANRRHRENRHDGRDPETGLPHPGTDAGQEPADRRRTAQTHRL